MSNYYNRQWRLPNNENKDKQSNYSMDFDASSSQYIDTNFVPADNLTTNCSISAWVNMPAINNNVNSSILGTYDFGGSRARFFLRIYRTSNVYYYMIGLGTVQDITIAISNFSVNTWVHLAVTYDGTDIKLYSNGTLDGTINAGNIGPYPPITSGFDGISYIGASHRSSGANTEAHITGKLDAVAIYNYALPATGTNSVATLYGSSSTGIGNPMSLNPKPVAYYPLGDQDSFNGADYLVPNSSLKDYVFSFDGSNDYIDLGNLQPSTTSLSISAWAYKTDATNASIIGRGASVDFNISIYSGSLIFGVNSGSWSTIAISNFTSNYLNQWFHVCATWDGSTMKLYLNGNEEASASKTGIITYTSNDTTIGKNSTLSGYEWDGKISNVQTYTTALPATGSNSVETLYNNGSPLTSMSGFTSLQGWWKLDASDTFDGTNWTIEDHAGSNDGTSSGMTQANLVQSDLSFKSGYSPYALDFDGTDDYIDVGSSGNVWDGTTSLSVSLWVNLNSTGTYQYLIDSNTLGNAYIGFGIQLQSNGKFAYCVKDDTNFIVSYYVNDIGFTYNNWHHIVLVYDRANSNYYYYNNGTQYTVTPSVSSHSHTAFTDLYIGRPSLSNNYYADGSISNVSVWNSALTSTQVTEIYNEGVPSNLNNHSAYSNLLSWWQLGSNSSFNTNWTVLDEKGSNDGTSVNMAEDDIVDGVGSYANGLSSGMGGDEVIGDAPYSTSNSLSVNMDVEDRVSDTPS